MLLHEPVAHRKEGRVRNVETCDNIGDCSSADEARSTTRTVARSVAKSIRGLRSEPHIPHHFRRVSRQSSAALVYLHFRATRTVGCRSRLPLYHTLPTVLSQFKKYFPIRTTRLTCPSDSPQLLPGCLLRLTQTTAQCSAAQHRIGIQAFAAGCNGGWHDRWP